MEPFFDEYRSILPYLVNDEPVPDTERLQSQAERGAVDVFWGETPLSAYDIVDAGLAAPLASGLAFCAGATNSYQLNRRWTFVRLRAGSAQKGVQVGGVLLPNAGAGRIDVKPVVSELATERQPGR